MSAFHHESHGQHPVGTAAFFLVIGGFVLLALALVALASGHIAAGVGVGALALVAFAISATTLTILTRRLHHSALLPDNTPGEERHYLERYRG
ncbi:MAG: hypothetical protein QM662_01560 [Gordonia sp. (in: high G+C Gram-positive bacteria)]